SRPATKAATSRRTPNASRLSHAMKSANLQRWLLMLAGSVLLTGFALQATEPALPANGPLLTNAQQVLDLRIEAIRTNVVRIRGVVTYPGPAAQMFFLQDASAGIRVYYTNLNYRPAPGQLVEAEGVAAAGTFAPFLDQAEVRITGSAPMPTPRISPAAAMAGGDQFGQWVQVDGVVRDLLMDPNQAVVFVSSE